MIPYTNNRSTNNHYTMSAIVKLSNADIRQNDQTVVLENINLQIGEANSPT